MGIAAVVFLGLGYTVPALVLWGLIAVNPLILIGISSLLKSGCEARKNFFIKSATALDEMEKV